MPITQDQPAPYAPASAILGLIQRHRQKGLPSPVNADVLARASISGSLIPRTLQAMQTLDLIDEDGRPTPILEGIRLAPESEYKQRLADWLTGSYADALQFVDPATADETQIRDAFRSYKPVGQQPRMVTLFTGLFAGAGIGPEKQRQPPRKQSAPTATRAARSPAVPPKPGAQHQHRREPAHGSLPPAIAGLLASLPSEEQGWTKAERERFIHTFGAVLDFCFPVTGAKQKTAQQAEEKEDEQ